MQHLSISTANHPAGEARQLETNSIVFQVLIKAQLSPEISFNYPKKITETLHSYKAHSKWSQQRQPCQQSSSCRCRASPRPGRRPSSQDLQALCPFVKQTELEIDGRPPSPSGKSHLMKSCWALTFICSCLLLDDALNRLNRKPTCTISPFAEALS